MSSDAVARREVAVLLPNGLHLRPMAFIARTAAEFSCDITISNGERIADAKSQMDLMTLNAPCGTQLILEARGDSASEAIAAIVPFLEQEFDDDD